MRKVERKILAVIPARKDFKRIKRKNVVPVGGKLLIVWSILTGLSSPNLDRVIVSTDDQEIGEIAIAWGAGIPFMRPPVLAEDPDQIIVISICYVKL